MMKIKTKIKLLYLFILLFLSGAISAQEKPPLTEKDLEKNTFYFEIADNKLTGDGAKFLIDEIGKSQYLILGEFHGSLEISRFTKAVIPIFHDAGCRNFGLEIGPVSAEILTEMSKDSTKTIENLKAFNTEYLVQTSRRPFTPIPFFSNVEDAEFLIEARQRNWNLIGLDQEFALGYLPLMQRIYDNLNAKKRAELKPLFERAGAQISAAYKDDAAEKKDFNMYQTILDSKEINEFFEAAVKVNPKNKTIVEHIKITTNIYNLNRIRKWYENNSTRINTMKKYLSNGFRAVKFDLKKDKMLLKMGGVHTGRGFSPLALFEIGNTLSELAVFNGNQSLHINFGSRFYVNDGKEVDALDDPKSYLYRFQAFLQMAKKDKWTVIDLRPLRSTVFYAEKYKLTENVQELFKNHDLYIIAPLGKSPTPNYAVKN